MHVASTSTLSMLLFFFFFLFSFSPHIFRTNLWWMQICQDQGGFSFLGRVLAKKQWESVIYYVNFQKSGGVDCSAKKQHLCYISVENSTKITSTTITTTKIVWQSSHLQQFMTFFKLTEIYQNPKSPISTKNIRQKNPDTRRHWYYRGNTDPSSESILYNLLQEGSSKLSELLHS